MNPADHHLGRIRITDKEFAIKPQFKDIKCPVNIRDIRNLRKKCISISVFGYENKVKFLI